MGMLTSYLQSQNIHWCLRAAGHEWIDAQVYKRNQVYRLIF
jgi:hypothetical protein